jgi:5-methyltetrahydrofolate--homocysteine methyltransferase
MMTLNGLLSRHTHIIADGAWGTELARLGLGVGEIPETWNTLRPDAVAGIGMEYVKAGAQIILTNTFGGNRLKLAKAGLEDAASSLTQSGAALSRLGAGHEALVMGSIGPTGEFMRPLGLVSEQEMIACFAQQVTALVAGGVDGFVIETMSDLAEARAALEAVHDNSSLPAVVSMTFEPGPRGAATIMGVKPEQAAEELAAAGAQVIGANCGSGPESMVEVIAQMAQVSSLPLWAKPNAGLPELIQGKTVFRKTPEEMAADLPALLDAGARIVGGCCGTTPAHIRAMARALRNGG